MNLRDQKFGVEIEGTGITRERAAEILAEYFGSYADFVGGSYSTYEIRDPQHRTWKIMNDASINAQMRRGNHFHEGSYEHRVELVTPICRYEDIETIQEIVRKLRGGGFFTNTSCGCHIHVDGAPHDARTLRNLVNIVASKEDHLYKALKITDHRKDRWCKPISERFLTELNQKKPTSLYGSDGVETLWYGGNSRSHHRYDDSRYALLNLHSTFQKGTVEFRAFEATNHAGKIKAYIQLCLAISAQAINQRSASPTKTQTQNEKYTFRTWLLRLGMIGDEFKTARQHLLNNLEGGIAWRDPAQAVAQRERLQAQRLQATAEPSPPQPEPAQPLEQAEPEAPEQDAFTMSM